MAIPLIQAPDLQSTPLNLPSPSASAIGAPMAALGDVARGIASVGNAFAQHAAQVQQFENVRTESERRQQIAQEFNDFEIRIAQRDPSEYLPELEKTIAKTQGLAEDPSLPPIIRERMTNWYGEMSTQAKMQTASKAATQTMRRAGSALNAELSQAIENGDAKLFDDVLARGVGAQMLTPQEAEWKRQQFDRARAHKQLREQIDADPITAQQQLEDPKILEKFPNLNEESLDVLKRYAKQTANHQRVETWEQIQLASMEGKTLSRDEVMRMAREGEITAAQAGSYLNAYHSPAGVAFDRKTYTDTRAMILSYDPAEDEDGTQRAGIAARIATAPLPKEYVKELQSQFKARLAPDEQQRPKHTLMKTYVDRIEQEWKQESFGNWFDESYDPLTNSKKQVITPGDFDKAVAYRHKVQTQFVDWLSKQPDDIDPVEVGKKYQDIKSGALDDAAPLDLNLMPATGDEFYDVEDFLKQEPTDPTKPLPRTSAIRFDTPIKLSNYGYASDTTPDSFSAKGIGHRNNQLIDGRSAAVSKSLAQQLGLKHNDWFIAHTNRGSFPVQYHDTVPDSDPRTGPLPPTIDIYRKTKGSNSWGGKVLAVEKLDGPPPTAQIKGSPEERKQAFFRTARPRTPDEMDLGLDSLMDSFFAEQLNQNFTA